MCKKYNGWTNYEIWVTSLWLSNDEYTYDSVRELLSNSSDRATDLKEYVKQLEEMTNDVLSQANMFSDLLGAALASVNWYEIVDHWVEDLPETVECYECGDTTEDTDSWLEDVDGDWFCWECRADNKCDWCEDSTEWAAKVNDYPLCKECYTEALHEFFGLEN
jgi:hypothetical protein